MRILLSIFGFLTPVLAVAHKEGGEAVVTFWARFFDADYGRLVLFAGSVIVLLTIVMLFKDPDTNGAKRVVFWSLSLAAVLSTLYIAVGTIHDNVTSDTGGPVHWHADFRVFRCGEELLLSDPEGFSNRVGTPEVHEHGDSRVHIEGTLTRIEEASLDGFFEALGGELSETEMVFPTNRGLVQMRNGELCQDGGAGTLQVFLWKTTDGVARQAKLVNDFPHYVVSPEQLVPPGDCVIFEFGAPKDRTEYLCEQYEVAVSRGDLTVE